MKYTHKKWIKSGLDLSDFLIHPCEIDVELYQYIASAHVPPSFQRAALIQAGEAEYEDQNGTCWYQTINEIDRKFYFIGVLPAFKTKN